MPDSRDLFMLILGFAVSETIVQPLKKQNPAFGKYAIATGLITLTNPMTFMFGTSIIASEFRGELVNVGVV